MLRKKQKQKQNKNKTTREEENNQTNKENRKENDLKKHFYPAEEHAHSHLQYNLSNTYGTQKYSNTNGVVGIGIVIGAMSRSFTFLVAS